MSSRLSDIRGAFDGCTSLVNLNINSVISSLALSEKFITNANTITKFKAMTNRNTVKAMLKGSPWTIKEVYEGISTIIKPIEVDGNIRISIKDVIESQSKTLEIQGNTLENIISNPNNIEETCDFIYSGDSPSHTISKSVVSKIRVDEAQGNIMQNLINNPNNAEEICDFIYSGNDTSHTLTNSVVSKITVDEILGNTYQNLIANGKDEITLKEDFSVKIGYDGVISTIGEKKLQIKELLGSYSSDSSYNNSRVIGDKVADSQYTVRVNSKSASNVTEYFEFTLPCSLMRYGSIYNVRNKPDRLYWDEDKKCYCIEKWWQEFNTGTVTGFVAGASNFNLNTFNTPTSLISGVAQETSASDESASNFHYLIIDGATSVGWTNSLAMPSKAIGIKTYRENTIRIHINEADTSYWTNDRLNQHFSNRTAFVYMKTPTIIDLPTLNKAIEIKLFNGTTTVSCGDANVKPFSCSLESKVDKFNVSLSPNTQYLLQMELNRNGTDSVNVEVDISGEITSINPALGTSYGTYTNIITTPSIMTSNVIKIKGAGIKARNILLTSKDIVRTGYFEGIQSVGDRVQGAEDVYKVEVLSTNYNLFKNENYNTTYKNVTAVNTNGQIRFTSQSHGSYCAFDLSNGVGVNQVAGGDMFHWDYIKTQTLLTGNGLYTLRIKNTMMTPQTTIITVFYDDNKFRSMPIATHTSMEFTVSQKINCITLDFWYNSTKFDITMQDLQISKGNLFSMQPYVPYGNSKASLQLPVQLGKVINNTNKEGADKLYFDKDKKKWCINKRIHTITKNMARDLKLFDVYASNGGYTKILTDYYKNIDNLNTIAGRYNKVFDKFGIFIIHDFMSSGLYCSVNNTNLAKNGYALNDAGVRKAFEETFYEAKVIMSDGSNIIETSYTDPKLLSFDTYNTITHINSTSTISPNLNINSVGIKRNCNIIPNTKYTINYKTNLASKLALGGTVVDAVPTNSQITLTTPSTLTNSELRIACTNATINNLVVMKGDYSKDGYSKKYFEGIQGVGDRIAGAEVKYKADILSSGKNLFYQISEYSYPETTISNGWSTFYASLNNGRYMLSQKVVGENIQASINILKPGIGLGVKEANPIIYSGITYTISGDYIANNNSNDIKMVFGDIANSNNLGNVTIIPSGSRNGTFSFSFTPKLDIYSIGLYLSYGGSWIFNLELSNLMIEEGSTKSSYVSSIRDVKSLQLPVQLEKAGNVSDRFYYDKDRGKWCIDKRIGTYILNGGEEWNWLGNTVANSTFYQHTIINPANHSSLPSVGTAFKDNMYSNIKVDQTEWGGYDNGTSIQMVGKDVIKLRLKDNLLNNTHDDKDEFQRYLSNNNVVIVYPLLIPRLIETIYTDPNLLYFNTYDTVTYINSTSIIPPILPIKSIGVKRNCGLKPNTTYTVFYNVNTNASLNLGGTTTNILATDRMKTLATPGTLLNSQVVISSINSKVKNLMVLEGDKTNQNLISYFEGIQSLGDFDTLTEKYKVELLSNNSNGNLINIFSWNDVRLIGNEYRLYGKGWNTHSTSIKIPIKITRGKSYFISANIHNQDSSPTSILKFGKFLNGVYSEQSLVRSKDTLVAAVFVAENDFDYVFVDFGNNIDGGYLVGNTFSIVESSVMLPTDNFENNIKTFYLPSQLQKIGTNYDRLYWDNIKGHYCIENNLKKVILDGTEIWTNNPIHNTPGFISLSFTSTPLFGTVPESEPWINTVLPMVRSSNAIFSEQKEGFCLAGNYVHVRVDLKRLHENSINGFKTWLFSNKITVYARGVTPVITDLPQYNANVGLLRLWQDETLINFNNAVKPSKLKFDVIDMS